MLRLSKVSGSAAFGSVASTSQEGPEEEAPASASNRTLNVTMLSSEWKSTKGGLSTVSRELAIQCAKHPNVEVSVYIPKCSEEDKKIAASHNVQLMEAQELPGYEAVDWLASVPENHAMDCIIGHRVPLGRQIPLIKRHNRHCKWIQIVHTAPEELGMYKTYADAIAKGEKKHQTEVRLCEMADQVVAVGPKLADAYSRSLRPSQKDQKVLTLTPGIFTEFSEVKQTTEEGNKFVVLVFGRGDSEDFELKGYDIAAKAIAELNDMSCHLMFVGTPSGKEEEVKEKLLGYGISPAQLTVRCFDESRERLAKLLCEVDLAIMPSRTEGFGLTALEALSAGLPVLVSGNSGLGEALKKVATGSNWIVASEEPKDWAKAICAVQEKGRDIRLEECEILREKYGAKYSWQKQCYSLVEAMQKISFAFLGLCVECESVKQKEPSSQDEALDSANLARPKEGTKETATTCTAVTNDVAQTGVYIPTSDEIFRLIVMRRLQMVPPSSVQEFEDFNEYMSTVKGIITQDVMLGSLLITVKCRSLQVLEDLWTDYTSGLLNEIVQKCLVTDDVLNDLGLSELKLLTSMREAEYKACKQILQKSATGIQDYLSTFQTQPDRCYSLDQNEMESFLELVLNCVVTEGSIAAVTELSRYHAVWDYILELSTEKYTSEMALQILSILGKICSSAQKQMSPTVSKIVRGFQQSVFFKSFLPGFVENMTEESDFSVVQSILEHVVSAIPASGPKVLPLAKVLSQNLVNGSCDLQTAKRNGQSVIDFLSKLSSIIALNVPEALEDLQSLQWKDLPLIPVVDEIHKPRVTTDDLPVIRERGQYSTEEEYFNTYFRLLREECFYKLRKGIHDFVTPGNKCDLREMMMYRISLRGVSTDHEKSSAAMLLSLTYEVPDDIVWEPANWLLFGDLLCISIDGSFREPVWAVVEKHIDQQRIVRIGLCDKANKISEAEFIARMQEATNRNKRAFMAESQTFYCAFAPAMEVLQHKDHVPFKEFLVYPDPDYMEPAEYINEIKSPPDWGIIFHRDSLLRHKGESSNYSLLKDFERIRLNSSCKSKLDETQLAAVELALKNKLVLIQGPPGTGKSFVGVALVQLLLSMNVPQNHGPILVVTYRNHALDNFLLDCVKIVSSPDVKIVRVGTVGEDADSKLKQCLLREVGRVWTERLFRQKKKLLGRLFGMQSEVGRVLKKLRFPSIFNADMFLEEASDEQTRSLLVNNEKTTVDRAEVATLLKEKDYNCNSKSRLRELVEKALGEWLPSQEVFNRFAGEKDVSEQKTRSVGIAKQKSKDEQDQENPNDFKDPSVEEKERLLAVDKDEEEEGSVKEEDTDLNPVSGVKISSRKLICVEETKVNPYKNFLDAVKVWELSESERVQLVYVFQSRNYKKASKEFLDVSSEYTQIHHQFKELRNQHDIEVMKGCDVIGMTVTGATIRANILADIKPAVMIVEEAAEILEGQLVAVIPPSVQHLIMIGDHKQLKPVVQFHRLKKHHHLDLSMFERLVNCKIPHRQLGFQCRMRDEIVDLLRELKIYSDLKTNPKLVQGNVLPTCVESSMYFWTHTTWESESSETSKRNTREAREITEVATTFCVKGGVPPSKITVLCSYRGQVLEIRKQFKNSNVSALADIVVTTIDNFQGQENDIILISLVRSNKEGKIGYLSSMNRLCVAISRARCGLYLFGNHAHLAKASRKGWKVLSDFMWKRKRRGSRFPFVDNPKSALPSESQLEGSLSTREKPT